MLLPNLSSDFAVVTMDRIASPDELEELESPSRSRGGFPAEDRWVEPDHQFVANERHFAYTTCMFAGRESIQIGSYPKLIAGGSEVLRDHRSG